MPNNPPRLGKVQLQIMQSLWKRGRATARQITDDLSQDQEIAHSTVQTLLRKMEVKGAITHAVEERTFVFVPLFQPTEVKENVLKDLLNRVFDGSVYGLVSHLLKQEKVAPEELQRLHHLIESASKEEKRP